MPIGPFLIPCSKFLNCSGLKCAAKLREIADLLGCCCSYLQILGRDVCSFSCLLVGSSPLDCTQGCEEGSHGSFPATSMAALCW